MIRNHRTARLTLVSLVVCLMALSTTAAMATGTYYVSPSGSDANTGGISDPFLTIPRAQTALRAAGGGTVYLRGGTYTLTSTVVFTNQDSNSTYQAYTGEVPIISGGVVLNNWTLFSGDIYRASVNWNFRGLFSNEVRLNYKNPVTITHAFQYFANVTFTDSADPSYLVNAGDWALDYVNGFVYYKTGGGAPTGTIVAGSLGKLFQITGTETSKVTNITFDHLYFYYNNWLVPGPANPTFTDSWAGNFTDPYDSTKIGEIPGAVEVEFANNATFKSCRIAHNASSGIAFGRGVINSQVVGSEVWDNGGNGIRFGYMGNTTADGYRVYRDPNGQTLTYVWYDNANWIEDNNVATDNYAHDNGKTYPTTPNISVVAISNAQINYNRTDNSQYSSIIGGDLYGTYWKANYNHITNANLDPLLQDGGAIYSASGQTCPSPPAQCNVGITGQYWNNYIHDTNGLGPLYIDTSNDQFTVNNNVAFNFHGGSILYNLGNNATLGSGALANNTTPTQADKDAAAASTGPRAPYYADLFGGSDVTVTFSDLGNAPLIGLYGGIDWGSQLWNTQIYQGVHSAWVNSASTSLVTQTFTLPAGTVLKGFSASGCGTLTVSSPGNPTQTYSPTATMTAYTTGWTTAATVVTVGITCSTSAWGDAITNIVYGNPPSYGTPATAPATANTLVSFMDRPTAPTFLTGLYTGINWGSALWYTNFWQGTHYAYINSGSTAQVTQTFTLPAGKVLKGLTIIGNGATTVIVQSSGNPDNTYSPPGTWTTYTTGWTTAAATVTIKVTCAGGAWNTGFTNLVYGNP